MKALRYYRLVDSKQGKVLFGFFFFAMLLLSRNTLFTSTIIGFAQSQITMFALVGLVGLVFLAVNRKNLKEILTDRRMLAAVLLSVIMLAPMVLKRDWQTMYLSVLLCLFVAVFFSFFISYRELARYFVLIMVALGIYSILAEYLLSAMVEAGHFSAPVVYYSESRSFYSFYVAFTVIKNGYFRNYGIFREPGLYQFFLLLALYLNNYAMNWKKEWQLWTVNGILAATMLTTFSTIGVTAMGLFAVVLFFDRKLYHNKQFLRIMIVCAMVGIILLAVVILRQGSLYRTLRTMVQKLFVINDSSGSRYEAIFKNIQFFLQHPLLGAGFKETLYAVKHNTASTLLLYAVYGVAGGTLNVLAWAALIWEKERKLWLNLLLLMTMIMAVNTQNFTTDVFFWLFPTMALVERGIRLVEKKQ